MAEIGDNTTVVNSRYFHICIQSEKLSVISIKNEFVPKCAWWLIKEYGLNKKSSPTFSSLIMDNDGLSLACNPASISTLQFLVKPEEFTVSPQLWRALIINVTGTAFELPGAVYFLANTLSREGLSIFHISTFESEVFLIQDSDVDKAVSILQDTEHHSNITDLLTNSLNNIEVAPNCNHMTTSNKPMESDSKNSQISENSNLTSNTIENDSDDENEVNLDVSWITPTLVTQNNHNMIKQSISDDDGGNNSINAISSFKDDFHLCVLPNHVILAKFNNNFDMTVCSNLLITMLLYDQRYSPLERFTELYMKESTDISVNETRFNSVDSKDSSSSSFMWGMWHYDDEYTILLEEEDIHKFPPNALLTSPQRWRVVKLCGRPISFHETGVVSSMSQVGVNITSLNISTATTNCTLVPEELLESTIAALAAVLKCPVRRGEEEEEEGG